MVVPIIVTITITSTIMIMMVIATSIMLAVVPPMIQTVISRLAVLVMPAMTLMLIRPVRLIVVGSIMMGLVVVRHFRLLRSLLLWLGLSLWRILSLRSGCNCRRRPVSFASFRHQRSHIGAAEQAEATRKPLVAGEEGQSALVSKPLEDVAIHPAGRRHVAIRLGHDAVAALLQLPAAAGAAEAGRAVQEDDGGGAVRADIKIECGAAHADRACRRQNLIGRGFRIAADPTEGPLGGLDGELPDRLGIVENISVDDDGGPPADRKFGAVSKYKLAQPRLRSLDAFVAVNACVDFDRACLSSHLGLDDHSLADRLGGSCQPEAA